MTRPFYTFLLYLLLPFTPLKLVWRARKQPEYLYHWQERYGVYSAKPHKRVIWLHCVSVGETRAAEPLVNALIAHYPGYQILLTHTTPTGRATSEQCFGDKVMRVYLPYDVPDAINRFLNHFKPTVGVVMETELWFNLIAACNRRQIPLLLLNARLSEKSAHGYRKLGKLAHEGLQHLAAVAAQTEQDAARLKDLGATHVSIMGNLKFDVTPDECALIAGHALRNQLGQKRPVFLAASTRDGEENLILDAVAKADVPNLLTVIVPRHPQRFDDVAELLKNKSLPFIRRSSLLEPCADKAAQVKGQGGANHDTEATIVDPHISFVLGDSMGEMFTYYASCDVAFIGGSLLPLGGQNLIEALSIGKPVIIGEHTFNFAQATDSAITAGAAIRVHNPEELAQQLKSLIANPDQQHTMQQAARAFTAANRGAQKRALALLEKFIPA